MNSEKMMKEQAQGTSDSLSEKYVEIGSVTAGPMH